MVVRACWVGQGLKSSLNFLFFLLFNFCNLFFFIFFSFLFISIFFFLSLKNVSTTHYSCHSWKSAHNQPSLPPFIFPGMYLIFYIAVAAFFSSPWDGLMKPFTLCGTFILQNLRLPLRILLDDYFMRG